MSIQSLIKKVCKQTAVYWGNPKNTGDGGVTYDDPVEIKCRWTDTINVLTGDLGEETVSDAKLLVISELDENGMLFNGTLQDLLDIADASDSLIVLDSGQIYPTPVQLSNVYAILTKSKIPEFASTTKFVNTVFLKRNSGSKIKM